MRNTKYYKGYGFVTQNNIGSRNLVDNRAIEGDGILDNIVKGITSIVSSNRTKDVLTEGAKAIAKSAGDKAGSKLVEKLTSGRKNKLPDSKKVNVLPQNSAKKPKKSSEQALKEIYGDSIFNKNQVAKQRGASKASNTNVVSGKGIRKIKSKV